MAMRNYFKAALLAPSGSKDGRTLYNTVAHCFIPFDDESISDTSGAYWQGMAWVEAHPGSSLSVFRRVRFGECPLGPWGYVPVIGERVGEVIPAEESGVELRQA